MENNLILKTDSYKHSHPFLFEKGISNCFYYLESRGGDYDEVVFVGLQYYLKEYLSKPISQTNIDEAEKFCKAHGVPFYKEGWQYILDVHKGYLPIRIRALPEGMVVTPHQVLMTVESTDPKCFWVPGFIETLLMKVWYPITVASRSRFIKKLILKYMAASTENPESKIDYVLNSFGYRGVSSEESAGIGGLAELLHFQGSDTINGILFANHYYSCEMASFNVQAATEHSVITSFGRDGELQAYNHLMDGFAKPNSIVACVCDSYDLFKALEMWGTTLKEKVINSGTLTVLRLDSGDPVSIVSQSVQLLEKYFGTTTNSKGFKILNNVRVLQGDGINQDSIEQILDSLVYKLGFSAENLVLGMGGGMLQDLTRDTLRFAYKLSSVTINGELKDVFKNPKTDPNKKSKGGRLDLIKDSNDNFHTVKINSVIEAQTAVCVSDSVMRTVWENGQLLVDDDLKTVKNRCLM